MERVETTVDAENVCMWRSDRELLELLKAFMNSSICLPNYDAFLSFL